MHTPELFRRPVLRALALLLLVFVVYQPAMRGGFIFDDDLYLTQNPLIAAPDGLARFWFTTQPLDYYPLSNSSLWLEWRLWGKNPMPYHVTNIVLHGINTLLLVAVLRALNLRGAWLAGALFACHPVAVEAAAWIAQRKSLLALLFFLASLLAYLRSEERSSRGLYVVSLACFAASLLAKTSQIALPPALLVLAWWRRGRISRDDIMRVVPFFALAVAAGLTTVWFQSTRAIAGHEVHPEGFLSRLAALGWVIIFYLGKVLGPFELSVVYPRWTVDPSNLLHWIPLLACAAFVVSCWRLRSRVPVKSALAAFAIYVVLLAPVLGFLDIGYMMYSLVADHWQYGAMPAILAPLAFVATSSRAGALAAVVALLLLAGSARERAAVFADERLLWADNVSKQPGVARGWYGRGVTRLDAADYEGARADFEQTVSLDRNFGPAHFNLGVYHLTAGNHAAAAAGFREALRCDPRNSNARSLLERAERQAAAPVR